MTDISNAGIDRARTLLHQGLRHALAHLDARTRLIAEYHVGFADAAGRPRRADPGKGVRGVLAVLSARAVGAKASAAVPAAVGVELVHHYSLLHDDIIDRDESRRHRPAAWTVFGSEQALLAGDAMAALSVGVVLAAEDLPGRTAAAAQLVDANRRMVAGQAADIAFESQRSVAVADALAMVADKTGALLECAASIGAVAVGGPSADALALADYGRHLGLAFQLVDDVIGLWGDAERTGKPVGSDVVSRKKSLPVVAALASGEPAAERLAEIYHLPGDLGDADVAEALELIESCGGRRWAQQAADRETRAALAALAAADLDADAVADLGAFTRMLCSRDH